jgi:hypothetical protein
MNMDNTTYLEMLRAQFNNYVDLRERRPGVYQLIVPLYHEDGDMVDIFLEDRDGLVRVSDLGMTLMRLSYSYDIDTPNKERIFRRILSENRVCEENGSLYVDTRLESLYPAILQFSQTVAKIANMRLYKREVIQSLFYEMVTEFVEDKLGRFHPTPHFLPIPGRDELEVDFALDVKPHPVFLFGVKDEAKARLVTISCLEFQLAQVRFTSFVVHEDFDSLAKKDRNRITSAADKQFVSFEDFRDNVVQRLQRLPQAG